VTQELEEKGSYKGIGGETKRGTRKQESAKREVGVDPFLTILLFLFLSSLSDLSRHKCGRSALLPSIPRCAHSRCVFHSSLCDLLPLYTEIHRVDASDIDTFLFLLTNTHLVVWGILLW